MNQKSRAWFYVTLQFLLIFLLVLSPRMEQPYGAASEVIGIIGVGFILLGSALLLYSLLSLKADWEESMLREKYPQYKAYAEKTPRFFPRLGR